MNDAAVHIGSLVDEVRIALEPDAPPAAVPDAIGALRTLGRRAYGAGDAAAYEAYQTLLFTLHHGLPSQDHWRAQYIASCVYDLEDRRMSDDAPTGGTDGRLLDPQELRKRLWAQQAQLTPLHHPMFELLFDGAPTRAQVVVYLRQQWLILQFFWLQFAELASQLERSGAPVEHVIVPYGNLWEELGNGDPAASHVEQHRARQVSLGASVTHRQVPDFAETMDYVNLRVRLMRSPDPSAALGSVFSQEATAQSYGERHHRMLQRVGIPSRHGTVYADHAVLDETHAEEVVDLAESLMGTRAQQERFLAGHRAQMLVWLAHMDRVVSVLTGEPTGCPGVPDLTARRRSTVSTRQATAH